MSLVIKLEILKINHNYNRRETSSSFREFDLTMKNVFQQLKKLKIVDLNLPGTGLVRDDMLVALASNNPGLRVLRVRGHAGFCIVKSIEVLYNKCPDVEELQIEVFFNCEEEIEKFSFPKLKHLYILNSVGCRLMRH